MQSNWSYPIYSNPNISMVNDVYNSYPGPSGEFASSLDYSSLQTSAAITTHHLVNASFQGNNLNPLQHHQQQSNSHQIYSQQQQQQPQQLQQPQQQRTQVFSYSESLLYPMQTIKVEPVSSTSEPVTSTTTNNESTDEKATRIGPKVAKGTKRKSKALCKLGKSKIQANQSKQFHQRSENKPKNLSYASMIWLAIEHSPEKKRTLSEIYDYMKQTWPNYFDQQYAGWKNSVRHNLSLNDCFQKEPKEKNATYTTQSKSENQTETPGHPKNNPPPPSKGHYWVTVNRYKDLFHPSRGFQKRRPRGFRNMIPPDSQIQSQLSPLANENQADNFNPAKFTPHQPESFGKLTTVDLIVL